MSKASQTPQHSDPTTWLRDAVQARVLSRLFSEKTKNMVLKGGLAMRAAHGSVRYTKDIDLDADKDWPMASVQSVVERAARLAAAELLTDIRITAPKQTDTTMRWKIAGADPDTGLVIHLTVEVSHRQSIDHSQVRSVSAPQFTNTLQVYSDEFLAFSKVRALLCESRSAPRDVCDLYVLIQADVKPPLRLLRDWIQSNGVVSARAVWAKIEEMDSDRFQAEVAPSLAPGPSADRLADWDAVRLMVAQTVEAWLAAAEREPLATPQKVPAHV